jgi:hypothetical protein
MMLANNRSMEPEPSLVKIVGDRQFEELLVPTFWVSRAPELIAELVAARALEAAYAENC